jgi:hypothetical protein
MSKKKTGRRACEMQHEERLGDERCGDAYAVENPNSDGKRLEDRKWINLNAARTG